MSLVAGSDASPEPDAQATDEDTLDLEAGRLLFVRDARFVTSAAQMDQLPPHDAPEVAFAGRSNVGKSSLINALTGQSALAKTSNTPGRTQLLNFFDLSQRLMLVDLPGYGYAEAPKKKVAQWTRLIIDYLRGRAGLRRVLLLIDSRHGIKGTDREILKLLDSSAVNYQVVLTKTDKISAAALAEVHAAVTSLLAKRPAAHPDILATSAETGAGIPELRATLASIARPETERSTP